jgi:hypothetical protein
MWVDGEGWWWLCMHSCCDNIVIECCWAWSQNEVGGVVFVVLDNIIIICKLLQLFSFSCASCLSGPLLPNPCDMTLLLLKVGFQRLLKAGIKSVELAPKQLLLKTGW